MTALIKRNARERILSTAHGLFYKAGIRATGIDHIIREAGVTKVTFYRHFPAKNDLILAFLHYRHALWITWFKDSLDSDIATSGSLYQALPLTLAKWFVSADFHGCAFINATAEIADALPEALPIIRQHKQTMIQTIAAYLPQTPQGVQDAQKCALLVDGAIVMAQREENVQVALELLTACLADIAH